MRKHNEGYALVLVLVVLIVLALLSTIILTGSQRNLDAQVTSVEYMKAKYQAQGEIEKIIASLESLTKAEESQSIELKSKVDGNLSVEVHVNGQSVDIISCCVFKEPKTQKEMKAQIDCTYQLMCTGITGDEENGYTVIDFNGISCASYEISTKEVTTNVETP